MSFTLLVLVAVTTTKLLLSLLTNPIVWVTAITTVVIPFLTAAVTRPSTPGKIKALVSFVLAGVYALVSWLGALNGDVNWKVALVVFSAAAAGAGGINSAWVSGHLATWLGVRVPINVGPKPLTPEKAAEIHSHESNLTEQVPTGVGLPQVNPEILALEKDPASLAAIKAQLDGS